AWCSASRRAGWFAAQSRTARAWRAVDLLGSPLILASVSRTSSEVGASMSGRLCSSGPGSSSWSMAARARFTVARFVRAWCARVRRLLFRIVSPVWLSVAGVVVEQGAHVLGSDALIGDLDFVRPVE